MHRLPLILCLVALAGTVLSGALYLRIGDSKRVLEVRLAESERRGTQLGADLAAAKREGEEARARAESAGSRATAAELELARTREKLTSAESRGTDLERNLADTRIVLAVYESTTKSLGDEITALRRDLDESRRGNASPEAVQAYKSTIAELERQLASARNGAALPTAAGASTAVFTNRAGRSTVLSVGPQGSFVVVNFGSARGAQLGHKLSINQGNSSVATAVISDVRANFSVAQVQPESVRGVLQKGDSAVLIR
jgi:hypothetical protein